MKITLDVSEFWLDEAELEVGLKDSIKNEVIQEIKKTIKEKIETSITIVLKEEFEKIMIPHMQQLISEIMSTEKVKNPDSYDRENPQITLAEYVKHQLEKNTGYHNPNGEITKLAKRFGEEMRERYDMLFASQIVIKMGEQGLLKEGVINSLLNDKKM